MVAVIAAASFRITGVSLSTKRTAQTVWVAAITSASFRIAEVILDLQPARRHIS